MSRGKKRGWRKRRKRRRARLKIQAPPVPKLRHEKKHRTPIPPEIRAKVRARDGAQCQRCKEPYHDQGHRFTIHHLNGDPSDHRFDLNRDDLKRNNLIGWGESCQQEFHHCQPRSKHQRRDKDDT